MMKRFYTAIVRRRRLVLAVFALAAVLSVFAVRQVKVDYDINDYLPPESPSTTAIEVMNGAFTGGIPNMRVMVRDVTVPQALEYKEKLAAIDGVSSVAWLDDSLDVTVPLQMQDTATVESYYKDGCALFTVTVEDEKRLEAVAAVRDLIGEGNALEGAAVSTAVATNSTVTEVAKIAAIAVVYVLFILILTTDSWAEPLLVLTGLGAAILLNNGTNLIFGTISFVTNAAGSILQLAVSLDYSVFLIHRFAECRAENPDASPEACMVDALCRSTGSILSSGLTTVIGFLALVLMQFQIGPDLGLALAKGVVLSLVTVFTFMPALTLAAYQWMDKTHHRPLLPSFDRFGRFVARIMLPMALVLVIPMVPSYLVLRQFGLLDTPWAIILPGIFSTFPVFIMERGFDTIPREVLESASIDGANQWQRFWRIGIPLGIPGLISALTLGFLDAWNAIEQPMTFLESPQYWPLSLFFTDPANLDTKQLGLAMAASLWMLLPSILVFRFGQTYLEAGLTKGAVKG